MAKEETVERVVPLDEFLSESQIEYAKVDGFKKGDVLYLGSVTAGDIIEWSEAGEGEAKRTAGLRLIVASLVDGIPNVTVLADGSKASGKRIANDTHIPKLRNLSHKVAERFVKEILRLNGMEVPGEDKKTSAEVKAKNA